MLSSFVPAAMEEMMVPGCVVLVRSSQLGHDELQAYGTRWWSGGDALTVDDHVRIGSNTKTMTGTVILQLLHEGLIASLDDTLATYLPNPLLGADVTIAQLLEMRSGLPTYSKTAILNTFLDAEPTRVWRPEELLVLASRLDIEAPGQAYAYSNTNTILLGLVIETLTGNPVEAEFEKRIFRHSCFEKYGFLRNTGMPSRESNRIPAPHPRGYQYGTNVETIESGALPSSTWEDIRSGRYPRTDVTDENPSWAWTAGSVISTARDLAAYAEALVGGGLLDPGLQKQRIETMLPTSESPGDPRAYGWALARFGPINGRYIYGHTGEIPGFNTFMGHEPDTGTTVIVWTTLNANPFDGSGPAVEITKRLLAEIFG